MSERRECFCGRRTVFEFGLTDDDGNAHTWRSCGKDEDGQGLDVNTLLSERMEQVERAEKAEAARDRLANQLLNEVPDSYIQMIGEATDAEAAIQRVREVCDLWQRRHDASIRHPSDIPAVAIIAVLNALDGTYAAVSAKTERRSHWDIDLVEGVGRRLIPRYRSIGYCTDAERHRIYTLIEFVEDWQDRNQQARAMSMTDNEAAIQRVRELHHPIPGFGFNGSQWCGAHCEATADGDPTYYPCATIRALDGGDA